MLFVVMIVFQLAGAIILLLKNIIGSEDRILKNCFPGSNVVSRDDNDNCLIEKELLRSSAKDIYLNIIAFFDLVIGYGVLIWNPTNSWGITTTVMTVIGLTGFLLTSEYLLCGLFTKKKYASDKMVPYSKLEEFGVDTTVTNKEIDEMFKSSFGE